MPALPAALQSFVETSSKSLEMITEFSERQPELLEAILARKEANPTVAGIVATTSSPKLPQQCKYTLEDTMVHSVMQDMLMVERAEKAKIKAKHTEYAQAGAKKLAAILASSDLGLPATDVPAAELKEDDIPDTILFKDLNEVDIISAQVLLN